MQMSGVRALAFVLACAPGVAQAADAAAVKKYALPAHGSLQLNVPGAWADEVRQPPGGIPPTIVFRARSGQPFEVLVSPIWRARPDVPEATKETIRASVQSAADEAKADAVEQTIPILELAGAKGPGYYFSATDKAPKPGEYKYLTQGMVKLSDLTLTFTILTNDGQQQVVKDALEMVKSAAHLRP
jgi:hypothetical protein